MNNAPKINLRFSSRGHRKSRVQMTFLVSVSVKLKLRTCPRLYKKEIAKKKIFQEIQIPIIYIHMKNTCMKI